MTLYEGEKGCAYKVRNMRMEESLMRRLQALGLNASGGRKTYQRAY